MNSSPVRLGLFGGTFNPVHFGHLRAAEEIAEIMRLETILFIPASSPPHKNLSPLVKFSHRFEMVRLATSDRPGFTVSDMEAHREGPSFTVDSLRQMHEKYGGELDAYFVVGHEAFLELPTWKDYTELFKLTNFVIINRPEYHPEQAERLLREKVSPDFSWDPGLNAFTCPELRNVYYQEITRLDVSSTEIRDRLARGTSIRYLVPERVRAYIHENNLYQNQRG